jgi:hypothetical protein
MLGPLTTTARGGADCRLPRWLELDLRVLDVSSRGARRPPAGDCPPCRRLVQRLDGARRQ